MTQLSCSFDGGGGGVRVLARVVINVMCLYKSQPLILSLKNYSLHVRLLKYTLYFCATNEEDLLGLGLGLSNNTFNLGSIRFATCWKSYTTLAPATILLLRAYFLH